MSGLAFVLGRFFWSQLDPVGGGLGACMGVTQSGAACRMAPLVGANFCFTHSPEREADREAARVRGKEGNRHGPFL